MDHRHFLGDAGKIEGFLDCGIAAADHGHMLLLVEEAVAGGASRHAFAHEQFFRRQAEILRRCAGRDDQGIAGVFARISDQADRFLIQLGRMDVVENDFRVEALGVLQKAPHQFRALHAMSVSWPVFDVGRGHQLAALGQTRDEYRRQVGACRVDRRRIAGGAGTENQNFGVFRGSCGHDRILLRRPARPCEAARLELKL